MSDFFQKIKDAASSAAAATEKAAKDASDGAKKMAEKSRIKREITTLETKLSADFREIGQKLYNDNNGGAPDASFSALFSAIDDGKKAIAAKNEELAMVDASRACPSCGKRIKQDATFCAQCGAKVEQPAPAPAPTSAADTKPCPSCGASLAVSAMFCPECGTKVAQDQAFTPSAQPEQAFTPQAAATIACPSCGAQVKSDAVFCPECGGRVAAQPEVVN